jgi:hypothetical protein
MTRALLSTLRHRLVGDRPLPVGRLARDRRLMRRALRGRARGKVLVVGPGTAVVQALPELAVDVAGTSPHQREVTVCSAVTRPGSLPPHRWDTIVVTDLADLPTRLTALVPACRTGGRLLVVDRFGWSDDAPEARALAQWAAVVEPVGRRARLWVAEVRS